VLVIVALVGRMPVSAMDIVHVVAVRHGIVAAAWLMGVLMAGVSHVRERVLVVVTLVGCVRVTIVDVVGMSVMLDARVPAAWAVLMRVLGMYSVRTGSHRPPVVVPRRCRLGILPSMRPGRRKPPVESWPEAAEMHGCLAGYLDKRHRIAPRKP